MSAQAGAALSKVSETAPQAGNHVKEAATSLATEAGEKAKGFIDQQVASGADFLVSNDLTLETSCTDFSFMRALG